MESQTWTADDLRSKRAVTIAAQLVAALKAKQFETVIRSHTDITSIGPDDTVVFCLTNTSLEVHMVPGTQGYVWHLFDLAEDEPVRIGDVDGCYAIPEVMWHLTQHRMPISSIYRRQPVVASSIEELDSFGKTNWLGVVLLCISVAIVAIFAYWITTYR